MAFFHGLRQGRQTMACGPDTDFVCKVLLVYILFMAAFALGQHRGIAVIENIWPARLKIFTLLSLSISQTMT